MNEKRIDQRIDTAFIVKCLPLPEEQECFYTVIKDLSSGGIQILCDDCIPLGKSLKIDMNLIEEKAEACAEVVWYYKVPASDRYCIGLKFKDVCDSSKEKLGQLISTICYTD